MGDKKKKCTGPYTREEMNKMADSFQEFLELNDRYIIKDGMSIEKYEEACKTIRKLIKHLRNGDGDKVFSKDIDHDAERERLL